MILKKIRKLENISRCRWMVNCNLYENIRIEARERWRWRSKQLLYDFKEMTGYWKLKEEALERMLWRTGFRGGYEHVLRHTIEW